MITINIEIKDRNRTKEFFHKLHGKAEDLLFTIISKSPERLIPRWLMNWLDRYTTKRINELKYQTIKMTWRNLYLQKSITEIRNRQQDTKKAPSDD